MDHHIAIVGMSGRFPDSDSVESLWKASISGECLLRTIHQDEAVLDEQQRNLLADPAYVPVKGIVKNSDFFDSVAFGYSNAEATTIDPQQRLFLELCAEAMDRAALDPSRFDGKVGVYAGQFLSTYFINNLLKDDQIVRDPLRLVSAFQGNTVDQLATRVAFQLGLSGPALTLQTACSTSLVAVHVACQALLTGECDAALAGGVALSYPAELGYRFVEGSILSRTGRCRPFDAQADGTVFSDGGGVVVLKRLEDAISQGYQVHAVILGSAINNDGATKVGYTAPSLHGQVAVLAEALAHARVAPDSVGYIETHGAGTAIGDQIEIAAISAAYNVSQRQRPLALGALKGNIGHCEAAAGIAGLLRAIFALREGKIPPIAGFSNISPQLNASPLFQFPSQVNDWPVPGDRIAAISAFGIGGTNAHVVLGAPPERIEAFRATTDLPRLYPISSHSSDSLLVFADQVAEAVKGRQDDAAIQATLALGRPEALWRASVVCSNSVELSEKLPLVKPLRSAPGRIVYLLFTEVNAICNARVRTLIKTLPGFNDILLDVCEVFDAVNGSDLYRSIVDGEDQELSRPSVSYCTLVATCLAATDWLSSRGIGWQAALGQGIGELVAASVSGLLTRQDLARLALSYGELRREASKTTSVAYSGKRDERWEAVLASCNLGNGNPFYSDSAKQWLSKSDSVRDAWMQLLNFASGEGADIVDFGLRSISDADAAIALDVGSGLSELQSSTPTHPRTEILSLFHGNNAALGASGLETLGQLWCRGVEVAWGSSVESSSRRSDVPARAFIRKRHFNDVKPLGVTIQPPHETITQRGGLLAPTYVSLPEKVLPTFPPGRHRWLLIAAEAEHVEAFHNFLEDRGQIVSIAVPGSKYERLRRGVYSVPSKSSESWTELLRDLRALVRTPEVVIDMRAFQASLGSGELLAGASALLAGLLAETTGDKISILHIARAAARVTGVETIDPGSSALMAWIKVAFQEAHAGATVAGIDLDLPQSHASLPEHLFPHIAQVAFDNEHPVTMSLRGKRFFSRHFKALPDNSRNEQEQIFRSDDVYLIIGGLGGIGTVVGAYLNESRGATVVTASRQERADLKCHYHLDAGDIGSVREAITAILAHYGRIDGVFLAAGLAEAATAREGTLELYNRMLHPKAFAVEVLSKVFMEVGLSPRFVLALASSSMVVGSPSLAAYAAANAALEAQMSLCRTGGATHWCTLALDTVSEIGMAKAGSTAIGSALADYRRKVALDPDEVTGLMESALHAAMPTVLATRLSPEAIDSADEVFRRAWSSERVAGSRPDLATLYVAPRDEVEAAIVGVFEQVLGFKGIGVDDAFTDLGGHSLLAAQLRSELNRTFGVDLRIAEVFECPTPGSLAIRLEEIIGNDSSVSAGD